MYQKMRKQVRQLVGSLLCAALLIGLLPSQVFAAETVNASISPDISVMVDGAAWTFFLHLVRRFTQSCITIQYTCPCAQLVS